MSNVVAFPNLNTPEFIVPTDITKMTDEEIDALIDGIRLRRMDKSNLYKQTRKLRDKASSEKMLSQLDRKQSQLATALEKVDKALGNLEKKANEVRALRLQLGESPDA